MSMHEGAEASILITLTDITMNEVDTGIQTVGFRLQRDGTVDKQDTIGYFTHFGSTNYISSADRTSTIGDLYEMKVVKTSGNAAIQGGLVDDTWYTINTDRELYYTASFVEKTYVGTLHVREIADTANEKTCAINLAASRL